MLVARSLSFSSSKRLRRFPEQPVREAADPHLGRVKPADLRADLYYVLQPKFIYCGDNLRTLPLMDAESADLVYIDPPFNTGAVYEIIWGEPDERQAFKDRYGDVKKYITWLRPRAAELVRVLKPAGSFLFHCDPHANYAIRALLQDELGLRFQSEIVWKRSSAHSGAKRPGPVHDTIYFFTKTDRYTWNQQYQPLDGSYLDNFYTHQDPDGRRWRRSDLTGAGTRNGETGRPWHGIDVTAKGRHWSVPPSELDRLDAAGRIHWPAKKGGVPMLKRYADDQPGTPLQDVWTDIRPLHNLSKERVHWPTQKPVELLDRLIAMASNPGDMVIDAFCGCGSTLISAQKLGRDWIGIDVSPTACRVVAKRMWTEARLREGIEFFVRDVPKEIEILRGMPPHEFENWAVTAVGGLPNQIKVGDKGIDGRLYVLGRNVPEQIQREFLFGDQQKEFDFVPIQAKQKDHLDRPGIDAFETAMRRAKKTVGIIIAFDFTRGAREEIKRAKREDGIIIHAFTVREILERQAA